MKKLSWVVRYDDDGVINVDEVVENLNRAIRKGYKYLVKIGFTPELVIETAFSKKQDAINVAERMAKYHAAVRFSSVFVMHSRFDFGVRKYAYLTSLGLDFFFDGRNFPH